jgi:hypothetical protein
MHSANTHIHLPPNFSAFESVEQAVDMAAREGLSALGASNYYDFTVYAEFRRLAQARGITPLFGIEIVARDAELAARGVKVNDPGNPGKVYLCGKGITRFDDMTPEAERLMSTIRRGDSERMRTMARRLSTVFAERGLPVGLTADDVVSGVVRRHGSPRETVTLQERHLAQAFQEAVFAVVPPGDRARRLATVLGAEYGGDPNDAVAVQGEIRTHLMKSGKPAFVDEAFVSLEEAKRLVLELGGIPCYPVLADGASPLCAFETPPAALIERLEAWGIHAAEFIPARNTPEVLREYVTAMHDAGFTVTAGTEHNTLDLLPLTPACKGGAPIPADLREIFEAGARTVTAHQEAGTARPSPESNHELA